MEHGPRDGVRYEHEKDREGWKDGGALDGVERMRHSVSERERGRERDGGRVDNKQIAQPQVESEAMIRTTSRAQPQKNASEHQTGHARGEMD